MSRRFVVVSWSEPSICRKPRSDRIHGLADLGDRVAQVIALDGTQADLLDDRVEERALDAGDRLARAPGRRPIVRSRRCSRGSCR